MGCNLCTLQKREEHYKLLYEIAQVSRGTADCGINESFNLVCNLRLGQTLAAGGVRVVGGSRAASFWLSSEGGSVH
ncbi:hypothetical protein EYF80_027071 [Liparis tanakae]|uniref:Uncharacterized protein n=1 Tax=Liparis tanakae TaxID=230148 RepID=A0A4Z2HA93_9TELE|nr:hypothetical protein EYF80_027071 [Liparis tanakae]